MFDWKGGWSIVRGGREKKDAQQLPQQRLSSTSFIRDEEADSQDSPACDFQNYLAHFRQHYLACVRVFPAIELVRGRAAVPVSSTLRDLWRF